MMTITENHVKELVMIKSINCESCGAGLSKVFSSKCKCDYCGNTNLILESGKTKILNEIATTKPETKKSESKPMNIIMMVLFSVVAVGLCLYVYRYIKNKK